MLEPETVNSAIAKILTKAYPPVIMTLEDVADVCGLSYNFLRNDVQHRPGFPSKLGRFKQPRWSRDSILKWAGIHGD